MTLILIASAWLAVSAVCMALARGASRADEQLASARAQERVRRAVDGIVVLDETFAGVVRDLRPSGTAVPGASAASPSRL